MPRQPTDSEDGSEREDEARAARMRVADVVGHLMEFWGFKRAMGRIWALLYLSPKPVPAAEIGAELQMSAGAVSMTLAELGKWGVVRRSWVPGDRRDFFEAEVSVWKLVSRVVRERELTLVREAKETLTAADRGLASATHGATPDEKRRRAFERERVGQLRALTETGEQILAAIVAGEQVSAAPLAMLSNVNAANDTDSAKRRRK